MIEWLLPWTERGRSGALHDSFLWRAGKLYVMDNHRLALWCWWQHLSAAQLWTFVHIDRHYDSAWESCNPWLQHHQPVHRADLTEFRDATWPTRNGTEKLYRWDTICSALRSLDNDKIEDWIFATADEGDMPAILRARHLKPWAVPACLRFLADPEEMVKDCIIDIDMDYFAHKDLDGPFGSVYSDNYLRELGSALALGIQNGRFGVVTIALSPTTTGNWQLAEALCETLLWAFPEAGQLWEGAPKSVYQSAAPQ
ncbi:MAG: hypothetical protein NTY23_11605 [Chloroflexi bacterium]|nr:hypothetical protein [Chloroflexota bacterium]